MFAVYFQYVALTVVGQTVSSGIIHGQVWRDGTGVINFVSLSAVGAVGNVSLSISPQINTPSFGLLFDNAYASAAKLLVTGAISPAFSDA